MATPGPILVVDDDEDNREALCELLAELGYAVHSVEDGQTALEWLEKHPAPCLVLLDLRMPGLSGQDVVEELERLRIRDRVGVIFTSAQHPSTAPAGVPFLYKPFDLEVLREVVAQHCDR
jgi:CheY-like chemotaxis protein